LQTTPAEWAASLLEEYRKLTEKTEKKGEYLRQVVSQLLVLMDGLTDRGRVLIMATTNYPNHIDPAILRPGRIDRQVFMGPPDKKGRTALIDKLLSRMPVADDVQIENLADIVPALSGAEIEHLVNEAGLLAVKEAITNNVSTDAVQVSINHFLQTANVR
jgi:transitional endoplasmic reticulum ATPase